MGSTSAPIEFGRRLLPNAIDDLARSEPQRTLYSIPIGSTASDGFRSVTASEFANAVNRAAWFLENALGGKGVNFETLGYMGPNDIRYFILVLGAVKSGYKLLLSSPRNSVDGHVAVAEAAGCRRWLVPAGVNIHSMLERYPMETVQIPALEVFLDKSPVTPYKFEKDFDTARHEPIAVLHTSGSTGHPKPVVLTHAYAAAIDAFNAIEQHTGSELLSRGWCGRRIYVSLPFFHAAGFYSAFEMVIWGGVICVVGPQSPSILSVEAMLDHADLNAMVVAPSILQELSKTPSVLEKMTRIEWVAFGGGPLSKEAGDRVNNYCGVHNLYGTTECGVFPLLSVPKENWNHLKVHPAMGVELRPHSSTTWEMFIVRKPELEKYQAIFSTFPDINEFPLHDLYAKHPMRPDLWLYEGRDDDILVLSNGEKVNPASMQHTIEEHPAVRSALVVGHGRFQVSVVIESVAKLPSSENEQEALLDSIFVKVEEANKAAPAHAQIDRQHVIFASADKPFRRTAKGTVTRSATIKNYEAEINDLYEKADEEYLAHGPRFDTTTAEKLHEGIRATVLSISGLQSFQDTGDLFAAGVDSLQVLHLQKQLQAGLGRREGVDSKLIYSNPSIDSLSRAIWGLLHPEDSTAAISSVDAMTSIFEKYTRDLPRNANSNAVVILTGSTGSVGSYLLDTLMDTKQVTEIWCLNRSQDAQKRQGQNSTERGLRMDWKARNVHFLKADLSQPLLGLSEEEYKTMLKRATHIIHNQWNVNFNVPLSSFEPNIRGVRHLVNFSSAATHSVKIFFVSSISSVLNWKQPDPVPENIIADFTTAGMGYGESKLVSENILGEAAKHGIPVDIARVGQIAGPVLRGEKGAWSLQEWLPTIVKSSAELLVLPSDLGNMNIIEWIPVDVLSKIIVELTFQVASSTARVFHLANPHATTWEALLPGIQRRLTQKSGEDLKIVPWTEWVEVLRQAGTNISGYKLLGFFEALSAEGKQVEFDTREAQNASTNMRNLKEVDGALMELWMQQWGL
jgi:thioester reductase-like protein